MARLRRAAVLAFLFLALAEASLTQGTGWNQGAHYALVRALSRGSPIIDRDRGKTGDVSWFHGHYYSNKAPGLAFVLLPEYEVLRYGGLEHALGRLPGVSNSTVGSSWALGLLGCILPGLLALLLVQRLGDVLADGYGTAAAVTIGLGTILLPFSTLLYAHLLSASLGFAGFALLWLEHERRGVLRPLVAASAGALAGFAITTEYPLALVAVVTGVYLLARSRSVRAGALYASGVSAGLLPLAFYNRWAFGSFSHLSYVDAVSRGGRSGHDLLKANTKGFFGLGRPSFSTAAELLFSKIGLVTLTPIVVLGVVGALLLFRRGRAPEGLAICALVLAYLLYNSGYYDPWGGPAPGPRFMIPIFLLLGPPLALLYRLAPLTTLALGLPSILLMAAVTATGPMQADDGLWLQRITGGTFAGRGTLVVVPFVLLVAAAVVAAARATGRLQVNLVDTIRAGVSLIGWLLLALLPHRVLEQQQWSGTTRGMVEVALLASVVLAAASIGMLDLGRHPAPSTDPS